jgi:hypothetical protein
LISPLIHLDSGVVLDKKIVLSSFELSRLANDELRRSVGFDEYAAHRNP